MPSSEELTRKRTAELIQGAAQHAAAHSDAAKVGTYYAAYLDEAGIESAGLQPLQPALERIEAIKERTELARALGATLRADVDVLNATNLHTENLFGLWVAQDLNDPKRYSPFLLQGGLVMPDRDYYLNPSQRMADIRAQYQAHIAAVLALAHFADAKERAARIFALERRIAEAHWSREDSEQVLKGNNHWKAASSRSAPRVLTGAPISLPPDSRSRTVRGLAARAPSPASPRSRGASRSRAGRTGCAFT